MQQFLHVLELRESDQRHERHQMIGNLIGEGLAIGGQLLLMYLNRHRSGPTYVPMYLPAPERAPRFMLGRNRNNALEW